MCSLAHLCSYLPSSPLRLCAIFAEGDETAKSIAVLDIENVGLYDLAGDALTYVKKTVGYANAHYPER